MADMKFLKRETRTFAVVTSVLIGIALLTLVIVGLTVGKFLTISVVGSSVIVFLSALFMGSMQIRVFNDYKRQNKFLCADGIFYICLTILVVIAAIAYSFVKNAKIDLRYFIFVFALAFAVWKIIISILGFKKKQYNAFAEAIIALFWILSGVAVLLTTTTMSDVGMYLMCVSNYLMGVSTIFYILFSYIYKDPKYLVTDEAVEMLEKEQIERQQRLARFGGGLAQPVSNSVQEKKGVTVEEKLEKLKNLKDKNFITEEEYEKRKKQILDSEL